MPKSTSISGSQNEPPLPFGPLPNGADNGVRPSESIAVEAPASEAIPPNPFDDLTSLQHPDGRAPSTSPFDDLETLKHAWQYADNNDDEDEQAVDILTTVPIRRPGKKWFAAH